MPNGFTNADAISLYISGVFGDANAGTLAGALGGAKMPQEVTQLDALISGFMPTVVVEQIGGNQGEGAGTLRAASTTTLAYTPPGDTEGAAVTVADGGSYVIEGDTASNYVRVRIDGDDDLGDSFDLAIKKTFNNLIGGSNISTTDSTAGLVDYRAGMFTKNGEAPVTATVYIGTLGTQRVSGTTQLGGAGSGTITTATANGFADWPASGWVRIVTSGGTLREIAYYESRTSTALTVPAAGRGLLGTTAAAGAADDTVDAVPGFRFAIETADADGMIQTISNATTAPSGVSWSSAITEAAGVSVTLAPLQNAGLWIHRHIPAGAKCAHSQENRLIVKIGSYTQKYYGLYRIAEAAAALYSIWKGTDARPTLTAAATATHTSLPFTIAAAPPVSGTRDYYFVTRYTDTYGLTSYNTYAHKITVDSAGNQLNATITPPVNTTLTEIGSGYVRLKSQYNRGVDASTANYFRYYVTTTGVDPDPGVDTPTAVLMGVGNGISGQRFLNVELGPYDYGTDLRVLVTSYRSSDTTESDNTTATTTTVSMVEPPAPARPGFILSGLGGIDTGAAFATQTSAISGGVVYWRYGPGFTELWANTSVLVFRALAAGGNQVTLHFPSDWTPVEGSVTGAGVAGAVEAASATRLYICVAGQRRCDINVTAKTFTATSFTATGAITPTDAPVYGPAFVGAAYTSIQVYDPVIGRWRSALSVNTSGDLSARWMSQSKS